MGKHTISFNMNRNGTFSDVEKYFEKQKENANNYGEDSSILTIDRVRNYLNLLFPDFYSATKWIADNCDSYEAIAVRYVKERDSRTQNKIREMNDKIVKAKEEYNTLKRKFFNDINEAKSKTIGCQKCESKINRKYVEYGCCPVCEENLLSPTSQNRLDAKLEKIKEAKNRLKHFKEKNTQDKKNQNTSGNKKLAIAILGWARDL